MQFEDKCGVAVRWREGPWKSDALANTHAHACSHCGQVNVLNKIPSISECPRGCLRLFSLEDVGIRQLHRLRSEGRTEHQKDVGLMVSQNEFVEFCKGRMGS